MLKNPKHILTGIEVQSIEREVGRLGFLSRFEGSPPEKLAYRWSAGSISSVIFVLSIVLRESVVSQSIDII